MIDNAFRRKSLACHPFLLVHNQSKDVNGNKLITPTNAASIKHKFEKVNEAYTILSNPKSKQIYDT